MSALTVIVPATDHPPTLGRCLAALQAAGVAPADLMVVREPARSGPAHARNLAARRALGDVLVFVDADVVVHPDAIRRIGRAFDADPSLCALFGSYDAAPAAPGVVSRFRNLLHHHVHHAGAGPAATFWAGLGAVRRDAFLEVGGFDARRYPRPSIEDIDLGVRLAAAGEHIRLDPEILGTHLKRWTLAGMVRTDLLGRGVPWVGLMLRRGEVPGTLNLGWRHRASAVSSLAIVAALAGRRPRTAALAAAGLVALNRDFYALLWRRRGPAEAVAGVALHGLHHLTAIAAVPLGVAAHLAERRPAARRS